MTSCTQSSFYHCSLALVICTVSKYCVNLQVKVLKAIKALTMDDVVLGQYVADPEGKSEDARTSYIDDPTVPKGRQY